MIPEYGQCLFVAQSYGYSRLCSLPARYDFWGVTVCRIHERKLEQIAMSFLARRTTQLGVLDRIEWSDPVVRGEVFDKLTVTDPDLRNRWLRVERRRETKATEENAVVYYVHRAGHIKIGYTTNLEKRLKALVRGGDKRPECVGVGPLELLHHHTGGPTSERQLHDRFAALNVAGEWFRAAPELLTHIERLKNREANRGGKQ